MTCTNKTLTVLAIIILVLNFWRGILSSETVKWIIGVAGVIIIVITWTSVECKPCGNKKKI